MHRFFKTNLAYRIISILLAIVLWLWVTTETNPNQEKVLEIPLETRELARDLMVADKPDSVRIRVEGRKKLVEDLTSRDIRAFVNLQQAAIGPNIKPVEVAVPPGLQLVSTNPSQVSVVIDKISEMQLPVNVVVHGEVPPGYTALKPALTPTEVIIEGPKSLLDTIAEVFVDVNQGANPESVVEKLPIKVRDTSNHLIHELLRTKPEYVEVYIPVLKDQPSQKLLLKPAIEGKPAPGYYINRVQIEPEIVEVYGPYQSLNGMDYLSTDPISVEGITSDLILEAEVLTPDGNVTTTPKTVKVLIEVEKE